MPSEAKPAASKRALKRSPRPDIASRAPRGGLSQYRDCITQVGKLTDQIIDLLFQLGLARQIGDQGLRRCRGAGCVNRRPPADRPVHLPGQPWRRCSTRYSSLLPEPRSTTTVRGHSMRVSFTIAMALRMASGLPTEVPPYFITNVFCSTFSILSNNRKGTEFPCP